MAPTVYQLTSQGLQAASRIASIFDLSMFVIWYAIVLGIFYYPQSRDQGKDSLNACV